MAVLCVTPYSNVLGTTAADLGQVVKQTRMATLVTAYMRLSLASPRVNKHCIFGNPLEAEYGDKFRVLTESELKRKAMEIYCKIFKVNKGRSLAMGGR